MGTFNADIKPTSPGLSLGNENQPWQIHGSDAFVDTLESNSPNASQSGTIRLASGEGIAWRNAANTADVTLSTTTADSSTTPADTLTFSGAGIEGPFISNQLNPASGGQIRLAANDVVNFRNTANSGDVAALTHNSDDTITVGGTAGTTQNNGIFTGTITGVNEVLSGSLTAASVITPTVGPSGTTTGTALALTAASGGAINDGGSVNITSGSAISPQNAGDIVLNGGTKTIGINVLVNGHMKSNTTFSQYHNVTTAGLGLSAVYGVTSQKAETSADTNVLTYTPPLIAGSYRIRFVMAVSAQNTATLGWTATWTDANAHAQAPTNLSLFTSGTAAPALTVTAATNGNYYGDANIDIDASGTAIVVKLTFSGTSFAALVTATIEQIA